MKAEVPTRVAGRQPRAVLPKYPDTRTKCPPPSPYFHYTRSLRATFFKVAKIAALSIPPQRLDTFLVDVRDGHSECPLRLQFFSR